MAAGDPANTETWADAIERALLAHERETRERCAAKCDVSGDTFCPDVDPGELFTGGARLAAARIRSLPDAPERL